MRPTIASTAATVVISLSAWIAACFEPLMVAARGRSRAPPTLSGVRSPESTRGYGVSTHGCKRLRVWRVRLGARGMLLSTSRPSAPLRRRDVREWCGQQQLARSRSTATRCDQGPTGGGPSGYGCAWREQEQPKQRSWRAVRSPSCQAVAPQPKQLAGRAGWVAGPVAGASKKHESASAHPDTKDGRDVS